VRLNVGFKQLINYARKATNIPNVDNINQQPDCKHFQTNILGGL